MAVQVTTQKKDIVTIRDFIVTREELIDPYGTAWFIQGKIVRSRQDNALIDLGIYLDRDLTFDIAKELDEMLLKSLRSSEVQQYKMYEDKRR